MGDFMFVRKKTSVYCVLFVSSFLTLSAVGVPKRSRGSAFCGTSLRNSDPKLYSAVRAKDESLVKSLLAGFKSKSKRDYLGDSLLHCAARENLSFFIQILLKEGFVEVDSANESQQTSLFLAAEYGAIDSVKALLNAGADPKVGRNILDFQCDEACRTLILNKINQSKEEIQEIEQEEVDQILPQRPLKKIKK